MSGILGIWHQDAKHVTSDLVGGMASRLAHHGVDGNRALIRGCVAFACQLMKVEPESAEDAQPVESDRGGITVFDGRLDDREELTGALGLGARGHSVSDSVLVSLAYERYGESFVSRLRGDYALGIYDADQKQLLLARDAMGARPLYFTQIGQSVLFASEIKALLAYPGVKAALNEESLAEFIFSIWDYSNELDTMFDGISRVPNAGLVKFTLNAMAWQRYFEFDTSRELFLASHVDYVEAYRETFHRAVKRRLRSAYPVAITVSGGLDSSSIFCTAHLLSQSDASLPELLPIAMVADRQVHPDAAEWEFQRAVEEQCSTNILKLPLSSFNYRDSEQKVWHAEAPSVIQNELLAQEAARRGARVIVSGLFGDNLLLNPQFLVDQVRTMRWGPAWRAYKGFMHKPWLRLGGGEPERTALHRLLWTEIRGYLAPGLLKVILQWWRSEMYPLGREEDIYSDHFRSVARGLRRRAKPAVMHAKRAHVRSLIHHVHSKLLNLRIELDAKALAMHRINMLYPFRDRDLVQLVMSFPGTEVYPEGDSRGIHREAMKGILPETVRNRRDKGDLTRIAQDGMVESLDLIGRIPNGTASRLGLLAQSPDLERALLRLRHGLEAGTGSPRELANLLALEVFTSSFFLDSRSTVMV